MIDEKKAQMRAEVSRQEEEARSEHTGNGQAEASANAQETDAHGGHENVDNEMIDEDDGYVVQDGNLTKDGVIVASGAVFETGFLLEDGRQVEDSAGDDVDSNGEDASMGLDDEPAENSEVMLWEP